MSRPGQGIISLGDSLQSLQVAHAVVSGVPWLVPWLVLVGDRDITRLPFLNDGIHVPGHKISIKQRVVLSLATLEAGGRSKRSMIKVACSHPSGLLLHGFSSHEGVLNQQ